MMMIAFITFKSSLVPLLEGLERTGIRGKRIDTLCLGVASRDH